MLICWREQPKERPTFKDLRAKFDAMLMAEKNDMYIALCIESDESQSSYCQPNLPSVTTKDETSTPHASNQESLNTDQKCAHNCKTYSANDKTVSISEKRTNFRQPSASLDDAHTAYYYRRTDLSNRGNRPIRLSLQVFTESENRYVESPMKRSLLATSPAINDCLESKEGIEMECIEKNSPKNQDL